MSRLASIRDRVLHELAVELPYSARTLSLLTKAPEWAVVYILTQLRNEGRLVRAGRSWKLRERAPVRRHV